MTQPPKTPVIVTLTGPSASGKTVLSNLLTGHTFETLVSTTTRPPRRGEEDGKDYHFVSEEEFERRKQDGRFVESVVYNGIHYGVEAAEAERVFGAGKSVVLVAEPHGVKQIHDFGEDRGWPVLRVFVNNPQEVLMTRLLNRLTQDVFGWSRTDTDLNGYLPVARQLIDTVYRSDSENEDRLDATLKHLLLHFLVAVQQGESSESTHGNQGVTHITERIDSDDPRIRVMIDRLKAFRFEQENWVKPALSKDGTYELVLDAFNEESQEKALDKVFEKAREVALEHIKDQPSSPSVRVRRQP